MSKFKRMNKLFAVLLVFTFVAGLLGTAMPQAAYAAEDEIKVDIKKLVSDIEDKDAKEAVLRLAAFKIIHGKEDGKYHPDDYGYKRRICQDSCNIIEDGYCCKSRTWFYQLQRR